MAKNRLSDYDSTAANNTDVGGVDIQGSAVASNMDDGLRELISHLADFVAQESIASATTTDLGSKSAQYLNITGTTTITGFGTVKAGTLKFIKFDGALTLTHNATSLIIPGAANITTAAGDAAAVVSEGSGNWRVLVYQYASGGRVVGDFLTLPEVSAPSTAANQGALYTKNDGTQTELYFREESDGDEVQITKGGALQTNSWEVIETKDITSDVGSADFTGFDSAKYSNYNFILANVIPATDDVALYILTSTNGGSSFDNSSSNYRRNIMTRDTADADDTLNTFGGSHAFISLVSTTQIGSAANEYGWSGEVSIIAPDKATSTHVRFSGSYIDLNGDFRFVVGHAIRTAAEDVDAVRFIMSTGNIESGVITMLGLRK